MCPPRSLKSRQAEVFREAREHEMAILDRLADLIGQQPDLPESELATGGGQ